MAKTIILQKKDGRLAFDMEPAYVFDTLANGTYTITIKRSNEKRSIAQNDLMWMWFACIERETGTPKMKTIQVGERMERIYNTSSKLNTVQMTDFLNKIQADAAQELGVRLPLPEDRFFECFYSQYNY